MGRDHASTIPLRYRVWMPDDRHVFATLPPFDYRLMTWRAGLQDDAKRLAMKWYVQRIWAFEREVRRPGE